MVWNVFFVFIFSMWVVSSMEGYYQPPRSSAVWGYFAPPLLQRVPLQQTPMEAMVELTNNLGVSILQDHSFSRGNFAFSPYGVASVLVVLYEGARSESARQIHRAVGFPFDKDIIRVGFRDIHRHLRSYFSHEGYLSGISLNKQSSSLKPEYKKILKFYGYDVDLTQPFDDDDDLDSGNSTPKTSSTSSMPSTTTVSPSQSEMTTGVADKNVTKPVEEKRNNTTTSSVAPTTLQETTTEEFLQSSTETQPNNENTDNVTNPVKEERNSTISISTLPTTLRETLTPVTVTEEFSQSSTEAQQSNGFTNPGEEEISGITSPTVLNTQQETATEVTQSSTETQQNNSDADNVTNSIEEYTSSTTLLSTLSTAKQDTVTEEFVQSSTETQPNNENTDNVTNPVEEYTSSTTLFSTLSTAKPDTVTEEFFQSSTETQFDNDVTSFLEESNAITTPSTVPTTLQGTVTDAVETSTESQHIKTDKPVYNETTSVTPPNVTTVPTTTEGDSEFEINLTIDTEASERFLNQTQETATEMETKTTANEVEEITNVSIDNGMLIPQPGDRETTTTKTQSTNPTTEPFSSATVYKRSATGNKIRDVINSKASLWLSEKPTSRKKRTITDYLKSPHSPDLSLQLQNGMYDTHVSRNVDLYKKLPRLLFLVDGAVDTPVPMMIYTNVFSYAYIPRLHSKALEFPLDDVRYKLLIILPVERRGLRQLIYDLTDYPLSNVLETVRPARVKAMVPTFMVEGFVILTSSLQKLGIWDVFDPRKANLSGMSTDPELYVRNVEQSVTVVIRNYVEILDIQTRTMAARQMEYEFEATHPFLYFVLDTDTNVALMAGQILDPLNSRIY